MNSFDNIHCDSCDFDARDEYEARNEQTHDAEGNYIWNDEAVSWEDGFHHDNRYDDYEGDCEPLWNEW